MTNMKSVNVGMNKYCGPAVLSILTGKSTDECARVISRINGQYSVAGVLLADLLKAADKLGFDSVPASTANSLYGTITRIVHTDGMYIIAVTNHFVVLEVNEKKVYFCDNHTKEPIPAASSARLGQAVIAAYRLVKRPETVIEEPKPKPKATYIKVITYMCDDCLMAGSTEEDVIHSYDCRYNDRTAT